MRLTNGCTGQISTVTFCAKKRTKAAIKNLLGEPGVTPHGETMSLEEEFKELQRLFAQKDDITQPRRASKSGFMEILLVKRKNMKIKIYQEKGHKLPHIHIDYGKQNHAASYSIESGDRLEGDLPKKYDSDVVSWLERNRRQILEIWHTLQAGNAHETLVAELAGDV